MKIEGCQLIKPRLFEDSRGYFFESFNRAVFEELSGQPGDFVQDNQSKSVYGVVRGLHYQRGAQAQAKLVRVIQGRIWDVFVDLRRDSPTFGQWDGVELSAENRLQVYIPQGCAHGFSVLSADAVVAYKCDTYYNTTAEGGIRYDDPVLSIDWKIPKADMLLSEKDKTWPFFNAAALM